MTHLPNPSLRKRELMCTMTPIVTVGFNGHYVSTFEALGCQVVPLGYGAVGELDPLASPPVAGGPVAKPEGDR